MKTIVKIDWYLAKTQLEVNCKCGKYFVANKNCNDDDFLIQCPQCLIYYRLSCEIETEESHPDERGDVILKNKDKLSWHK